MFLMLMQIIGWSAALTSTICLIPQITKVLSSRRADDLSYWMLVLFLLTSLLWVIYGFSLASAAIWVCNLISLFTAIFLLILKIRYV